MTNRYPQLTPAAIRRLTANTEPWMSCDDCFEQLDDVIERILDGEKAIPPRLRAHLIGCGACFEEAWSLLLLAAEEHGANPGRALLRMKGAVDCDELTWPEVPAQRIGAEATDPA